MEERRTRIPQDLLPRLIGLFTLLLIVASWRLWTPQHAFPQVPLWAVAIGSWRGFDWLAVGGMVLGASGLLVGPVARGRYLWGGLLCGGYLVAVVLDQHRLQPWAYQLVMMALVVTLLAQDRSHRLCRWLTVSLYAYSAWSKLDLSFLQAGGMGQRLVATLLEAIGLPIDSPLILSVGSYLIVGGEATVALLLLIPASRKAGVAMALVLHVALLLILGPLGLNHTAGVLLWNLFFLGLIPLLFWPREASTPEQTAPPRLVSGVASGLVVIAIGLPLFEPLDACDNWLAWSLYSSRNEQAIVLFTRTDADLLPIPLKKYLRESPEPGLVRFRLDWWSLDSLGVPIYPENRFRLAVAQHLIEQYEFRGPTEVLLIGSANRLTGQREIVRLRGSAEIASQADRYWFNAQPRAAPWTTLPASPDWR